MRAPAEVASDDAIMHPIARSFLRAHTLCPGAAYLAAAQALFVEGLAITAARDAGDAEA